MNAMKTEQVRQVRRAALAVGVGAVLVGGVLLFVPDEDRAPEQGPEARARAAVGVGAPAALSDLTALIRERENWLRTHPEDGQAWAVLGSAYVERGVAAADPAYYPKADRALQRSLAVQPGGPGEGQARGAGSGSASESGAGSGSGTGKDGRGAEDGKPGKGSRAGNPEALMGLASLANARHDYVAARRWGESVRTQRPEAWTSYPVLIDAYTGLGDYKAAGRALEKLRALHSGAPVLIRAAEVYRDRGRSEDAVAKATDAAARAGSPAERAKALDTLGELALERGEPTEALGHYEAALTAARGRAQSLAGRARALASMGRADEATREYQTALAKLPRPEYALDLGELYDSLGLDGDAQTQYETLRERAERAQGHGVNEELVLGRFEADHGDPKAAVARLRAEWAQSHRNMEVADALGWALYRAGQGREALAYATKATEPGRRSALFSYHRGEIERSLGMYGAARRHIEEALRTDPQFSPLLAPQAREALDALGEPEEGGPKDFYGSGPEKPTLERREPAPPPQV
ncbi:tetratricopeptide repeat protein [Streptomyces sp. NPDC088147]|uniref:tetratricopeptide repeat protein n=1 Tax=unclassified Streptomyces TaxID=2593676 RepID=UPI0033B5A37E